jgi:hypothetical protein
MGTARTIRKPSVFEHENRGGGKATDWDVEGATQAMVEKRHRMPIVVGTSAYLPLSQSHESKKTSVDFALTRRRALDSGIPMVCRLPVIEYFPLRIR